MGNVLSPSILIVTTKVDIAADYVVLKLSDLGADFYRVNTEDLPLRASSAIQISNSTLPFTWFWTPVSSQTVYLQNVKSIWFRRHRLSAMPAEMSEPHAEYCLRESEWFIKGALNLMSSAPCQIAWMSQPSSIQQAESKVYQLRIAKALGFRIPNTLITNNPDEVRAFYAQNNGLIIAKPLRLGYFDYGEKQTCVYTNRVNLEDLRDDTSIRVAPVIFQNLIPKLYDIRVTVVGHKLFAAAIHSQSSAASSIDWRADAGELLHTIHELPENISAACLKYVAALGLNYGAIDLILTPENEYVFLEINPNGQWAWLEDELNLPISTTIASWLFEQAGLGKI